MKGYYEAIDQLDMSRQNIAATVISGPFEGEKAIFADHKICFMSHEKGFFSEHDELADIADHTGILNFSGTGIFCEMLSAEKKLIICGGGHISLSLIGMGRMLGFHVTVIEDRMMFADQAKAAGADCVLCDDYVHALEGIQSDGNTYFVIVTRGHRHDRECLETIITKPNAYIGMIGSRSKVNTVMTYLAEMGIDQEIREAVHTPIGLKIGAETPAEIAVSIIAEIIKEKNRYQKSCGYDRKLIQSILAMIREADGQGVLATIISRKGSAPREVGAKMLIGRDGRCTGTIGGGCLEAEVITKARQILASEDIRLQICTIDMTGTDAEDEGMVCGGIEEILLEMI